MRHLVFGIAVAVVSLMTAQGMADDQQIADLAAYFSSQESDLQTVVPK